MEALRVAVLTSRAAKVRERLLEDPNRGAIWTLVDADDAPDYVLVFEYEHTPPVKTGRVLLLDPNETSTSIHILNDDGTRGPLFLIGPLYPLPPLAIDARDRGDFDLLFAYEELHRRWMMSTSWAPMLIRALELLAGGTMRVVGGIVWIDGAPGACRFGEAPAACHEPESMVARGIPRSCPFIAAG